MSAPAATYVVTGASSGIGQVAAVELADSGAHVVLACRSRAKAEPVLAQIAARGGSASFVELDLADLASVRTCARQLLEGGRPLTCLINNAGLAGARGLTKDGFEIAFGTNHLGPYLLTRLLLPLLSKGSARVVNVSSEAHYRTKKLDWAELTRPTITRTGFYEYARSKLCNVLFTRELARRLGDELATFAVHPGVVATDVWRHVPAPVRWIIKRFMLSPQQGARSMLAAATAPELREANGAYLDWNCKLRPPSRLAEDPALAGELWRRSASWVGLADD